MNANFKLILRTDHKDREQRSLIFLRITSRYKVKYFSTARRVQETFWNKDREQVRSNHPDSVELNQYLEGFVRTARERFRQTGFNINRVDKNTVMPDVLSFIDKLVKDHNKPEQFRTRQKYITLKKKLVEFTGTNRIPFEKVNKNLIQEFDSFLQLSHYNRVNTRIKYLEMLRRTVNLAIEEGIVVSPFPKLRLRKEQSEKRRLTIDEIKRLQRYDAPVGSRRYHARDMWLLSFFCGGLRFEDTVLLQWSHFTQDGSLHFTMGKTGKQYQIAILPEAKEIIARYAYRSDEYKYIFPLMPENVTKENIATFKQTVNAKNSLINNKLAVIAKHLGIEKFTFHCARHSIADYLRLKKVDLYTVSKILRHSNLKTTELYLKQFDTDSISEQFASAFKDDQQK